MHASTGIPKEEPGEEDKGAEDIVEKQECGDVEKPGEVPFGTRC